MLDAMSDVSSGQQRATSDKRLPVNSELFVSACAAKGARTEDDRAALLGTTAKMSWNYRSGKVEPRLTTARRIAATLGVSIDELWPAA